MKVLPLVGFLDPLHFEAGEVQDIRGHGSMRLHAGDVQRRPIGIDSIRDIQRSPDHVGDRLARHATYGMPRRTSFFNTSVAPTLVAPHPCSHCT